VLTGFLSDKGEALGRPVGVAMDRAGALPVADDVDNVAWRVGTSAPRAAPTMIAKSAERRFAEFRVDPRDTMRDIAT
jgi:hypothetical protein